MVLCDKVLVKSNTIDLILQSFNIIFYNLYLVLGTVRGTCTGINDYHLVVYDDFRHKIIDSESI